MTSKIFSLFDEYHCKENGKHTLRAMRENARQGFFNGVQADIRLPDGGDQGDREQRTQEALRSHLRPLQAEQVKGKDALYQRRLRKVACGPGLRALTAADVSPGRSVASCA
jgi:hypothetical protein